MAFFLHVLHLLTYEITYCNSIIMDIFERLLFRSSLWALSYMVISSGHAFISFMFYYNIVPERTLNADCNIYTLSFRFQKVQTSHFTDENMPCYLYPLQFFVECMRTFIVSTQKLNRHIEFVCRILWKQVHWNWFSNNGKVFFCMSFIDSSLSSSNRISLHI